jgi:uncharacterized membrane protein YfhO
VEVVSDDQERLARLAGDGFDPRQVAYVEQPVELPAACRGSAEITEEIPTRIRVSLDMRTAGLLVLADLWDPGWRAYLGGRAVPILRANHALRGVAVPAGTGSLEFRYEPSGEAAGLLLCAIGLPGVAAWFAAAVWRSRRAARQEHRYNL